ncbi:MAG: S8/S53 family peptidase [Bacteroidota bacterium]
MKRLLNIFVTLIIIGVLTNSQPKKLIFPKNVVAEANFYSEGHNLLSDAITVKFREKVVISTDDSKSYAERIDSKFNKVLNSLKQLENKAGSVKLIKQIKSADENNLIKSHKRTGKPVKIKDLSQLYSIRFKNPVSVKEVVTLLSDIPEVEYVHAPLLAIYHYTPSDPMITSPGAWGLQAVQAYDAWNITQGSSAIKIGIVDGGVSQTHEDIEGKIFRSDNSISHPHGTLVAGVAGANTDNAIGIASLGFNVKLNSYDIGSSYTSIANALYEATTYSDVINMSWSIAKIMTYEELDELGCIDPEGWENSKRPYNATEIETAVENAINQGIVCVAATGNTSPNGGFPDWSSYSCDNHKVPFISWPAQYPNVIGVSGTTLNGTEGYIVYFNYGNFVDVSAPGDNIETTEQYGGYGVYAGTSFSAPLTAALAGLLLSCNSSLTIQQVTDYITKTTDKIDANTHSYDGFGWNQYLGYGRINAYKAVQPPAAPQNLSYINNGGHPKISWSANSEWDVTKYEIWRDMGSGYSKIAEVNSPTTSYDDYDLTIGGSNPNSAWYYVKAKDLTNLLSNGSSSLRVRYSGVQNEMLEIVQIPSHPTLYQNFPNPFNPTTTIKYSVPNEQYVSIKIFNGVGQEITTITEGVKQPGFYQIEYDAKHLSSGLYFYTMSTGNTKITQKMLLQK